MSVRPLFIPLRKEWFSAFQAGTKTTEFRAYGPRWNEHTCRVGRPATLSLGYSGPRISRVVSSFKTLEWHLAPTEARAIYPDAAFIAAIGLTEPHS
jgi:hypothetical protein